MFLPYKGNKKYKIVIFILYKREKNGMLSFWKAMETYKPMYQAAHFPFHGKRNFWKTPIQTEVLINAVTILLAYTKQKAYYLSLGYRQSLFINTNRKVSILHDGFPFWHGLYGSSNKARFI